MIKNRSDNDSKLSYNEGITLKPKFMKILTDKVKGKKETAQRMLLQ